MAHPRTSLIPCLALTVALLAACGDDDDTTAADPGDEVTTTETTTGEGSEDPAATGDTVSLERSRFDPKELEVAAGTEVTFENLDPYAHTVTSAEDSAVAFDSGELGQDETFSQAFEESGTYEYFCEIHPTMKGTVVVS